MLLLAVLWCASALGGCGSGSARSNSDPSQDLSRLKSGPSPDDLKAMQEAAKGNASGPPPQAANAAPAAGQGNSSTTP